MIDFENIENFWDLEKENLKNIFSESSTYELAKLVNISFKNQIKNEENINEITELLKIHFSSKNFEQLKKESKKVSFSIFAETSKREDLDNIWGLVLDMPNKMASIFIEKIPAETFMSKSIGISFIDSLYNKSPYLRMLFLSRRDINLYDMKSNIFFSNREDVNQIREEIIAGNFSPTFDDFFRIMKLPPKEIKKILDCFSIIGSWQIELVYLWIIKEIQISCNLYGLESSFDDSPFIDALTQSFNERVKIMKSENHEEWKVQERLLYIYFFAFYCSNNEPPSLTPMPLKNLIKKRNTWNTFYNFNNYLNALKEDDFVRDFSEKFIRDMVKLDEAMFYELSIDDM
jgi:hypothetical protein